MRKLTRTALTILTFCCAILPLPKTALPAETNEPTRPTIGLALGSGGATGLSHIAMLEVLDEMGLKPQKIAGSSIGAIIGSLYAAGMSGKEIRDLFQTFAGSNTKVVMKLIQGKSGLALTDLMQIDLENGGLFSSEGFIRFLGEKMGTLTFENLPIPLMVVATDYWSGEEIIFKSGDLLTALQASMAVPGLFPPEAIDGRLYIDGGTSNPLPYDHLLQTCDIVIAIDVAGTGNRIPGKEIRATDVLFDTFKIMQQSITSAKMKYLQPHIYIRPEIHDVRLLHFNRMETILQQSQPAAEILREKLHQALPEERGPAENS
ncbi:patatin-like phospholipase family protein [Desulfobotulus sp. H1]|uniref:Patatin-like phospholipase family protein n=1 Tax=Desulfobotulus pelophilus TaxID=2823377 RepID=A0ABT3NBF7_9BACT|nr:patatin-like phospholipase family protein [Desulfobotulus pelophilus]MCW7754798.1 patatin-like phospholipase family protein [Desulfobotulus pelophilus]